MNFREEITDFFKRHRQTIDFKDLMPHQLTWLEHIHNNRWSFLAGPREHGKSTVMKGYAAWCICKDHDIRVLIASHKEEIADEFARSIQITLERPDVQKEYGFKPGKPWRVGKAFLESKAGKKEFPTLKTVAKEAGMTGGRFNMVFFDDLITVKNVATLKRRAKLERWVNSEVIPALDHTPKQKQVVIGTRKHLEDWYSKILENPYYESHVDQLYKTVDDKKVYLWPERFNEEEEDRLRATLTPQEFAMEYMNSPIAPEGLRFKESWLKYYDNLPPSEFLDVYMGVDPSMGSKSERSSYMAIAVIAFDRRQKHRKIYVLDMYRKRLSFAEQIDIIIEKFNYWKPKKYAIEGVLVNRRFAYEVKDELPDIRVVSYKHEGMRGTTDTVKELRIETLIGRYFKNGDVYLRNPDLSPSTKMFLNQEYLQFPEGGMDILDALNMAVDEIDLRVGTKRLPIKLLSHGRKKRKRLSERMRERRKR